MSNARSGAQSRRLAQHCRPSCAAYPSSTSVSRRRRAAARVRRVRSATSDNVIDACCASNDAITRSPFSNDSTNVSGERELDDFERATTGPKFVSPAQAAHPRSPPSAERVSSFSTRRSARSSRSSTSSRRSDSATAVKRAHGSECVGVVRPRSSRIWGL